MALLEVSGLRKTFGSIVAVEEISFSVEKGEVFTIIGPNGAGKTTTLEMIEGLQKPDQGEIRISGMNWSQHSAEMKQLIGVQPQSSALFDNLNVYENLDVFASFYKKSRSINEIMELINLTEHRKKRVSSLSGGQKQRLAVGLALVNDPELLFLDEPTTGLDPQARRNLWDIVLKLKEMGKTTILTTHYMEEADKLSDRVCIVDQGKVVAINTPKKLIEQLSQEREVQLTLSSGIEEIRALKSAIETHPATTKIRMDQNKLTFSTFRPEETLYEVFKFTTENHLEVEQIRLQDMSLEDVFIAFTGKEWRD
ncbi:ATP-binding cassette domain-containing protein [Paenibacillus psychroresistens]|uniref:ATP-binding cassette domain-containing protein n=1 Tax=Paenibacillus psychroresistens TaxID=1778678 RepID=A0A6B8RJL3_9BACL|nr:ATP-binding cassette domain-containing protein [Paenibacillus psychroresistens]QGQ95805.1 ATP-binding cassette domain-containing protein [Paenibacillus psychroresistens]